MMEIKIIPYGDSPLRQILYFAYLKGWLMNDAQIRQMMLIPERYLKDSGSNRQQEEVK